MIDLFQNIRQISSYNKNVGQCNLRNNPQIHTVNVANGAH